LYFPNSKLFTFCSIFLSIIFYIFHYIQFQFLLILNFQMFKLVLEKAEEPEIKLPTSAGSSKNQESSRKTSISALLTMPKPLTVWITINWKILKEMGIPDHLTCLLRHLYAGQEATVRTGHRTTDWFQIGKGVHQGYILSPCLFNLYAEYIMRNAGLEEAQVGIKIAGRVPRAWVMIIEFQSRIWILPKNTQSCFGIVKKFIQKWGIVFYTTSK